MTNIRGNQIWFAWWFIHLFVYQRQCSSCLFACDSGTSLATIKNCFNITKSKLLFLKNPKNQGDIAKHTIAIYKLQYVRTYRGIFLSLSLFLYEKSVIHVLNHKQTWQKRMNNNSDEQRGKQNAKLIIHAITNKSKHEHFIIYIVYSHSQYH